MKSIKIFAIIIISFVSCSMFSCDRPVNLITGHVLSTFWLDNDTTNRYGDLVHDATLKAISIPCDQNRTLRMYISDSLDLTSSVTYTMRIVNSSKAGHLAKQECYFEVTTSPTDTYLSTGSSDHAVTIFEFTPKPADDHYVAKANHISVQHFTSSPQPDSTFLNVDLEQF